MAMVYPLAAVGVLMVFFSAVMIASPPAWSRAIVSFAGWRYFHVFEIVSRLLIGLVLALVAGDAGYPTVTYILAAAFLFAGLFLILIGKERHRAFAAKAATFVWLFRPAGVAWLAFGVFIIHAAIR